MVLNKSRYVQTFDRMEQVMAEKILNTSRHPNERGSWMFKAQFMVCLWAFLFVCGCFVLLFNFFFHILFYLWLLMLRFFFFEFICKLSLSESYCIPHSHGSLTKLNFICMYCQFKHKKLWDKDLYNINI